MDKFFEYLRPKRAKIQSLVLSWAQGNLNSYPWRNRSSPYEILVAELLLKRTTAKAASRIYDLFLNRYQSIGSLADANLEDLESILKPIGYNRLRSKQLKQIGKYIVNNYEGKFPSDFGKLIAVPYIGPYCAGAILCFAFEHCAPMVDSNVNRIISRIFMGLFQTRPTTKLIFRIVSYIIPHKNYKSFNLSLIDLGRTICIPINPRCKMCPLVSVCDYAIAYEREFRQ